jgi:hypothetical protein
MADAVAGTSEGASRPGGLREPVVISHDGGAYATFNEAIKVEDYKASYIEAL